MQLSMIPNRSLLVAHLSGELDHHITGELREAIDRELMRRGVRNLAFDLTQMSFMDSSGLGLIMGRFKKVSAISMPKERATSNLEVNTHQRQEEEVAMANMTPKSI